MYIGYLTLSYVKTKYFQNRIFEFVGSLLNLIFLWSFSFLSYPPTVFLCTYYLFRSSAFCFLHLFLLFVKTVRQHQGQVSFLFPAVPQDGNNILTGLWTTFTRKSHIKTLTISQQCTFSSEDSRIFHESTYPLIPDSIKKERIIYYHPLRGQYGLCNRM